MIAKSGRRRSILGALAVAALTWGALPATGAVDPMVDAQQFVYELNRARWNPVLYASSTGVDMPVIPAAPPVAVHPDLFSSAMFKADEMAEFQYFAHQSPVTGTWPNGLVRQHGFPLPDDWPDDGNWLESIQGGSNNPFDVLRAFAGSPIHRAHVFGEGGFLPFTEIGVGRSSTGHYWVVHLTHRAPSLLTVTGVVFDDADGDGIMDPDEGLPGVTVAGPTGSTITNAGGGYALPLGSGDVAIVATIDGIPHTASYTAGPYSVGVDFVAGGEAQVRAYELCNGLQPTILGTDGDDVIYGTEGPDVIHGLGGDDVIRGLGGDDVVCGGDGKDVLIGNGGRDSLFGGDHRDKLKGGGGADTLRGEGGRDVLVGGPGDDDVRGNRGADKVKGKKGDDILDGGPGTDHAEGGEGIDTCRNDETRVDCER